MSDILGPWRDPSFESGLIVRCRAAWHKPFDALTNEELATFLRQKMAVRELLPIAEDRVASGYDDDSEMFDGELEEVIQWAKSTVPS